MSKETTQEAKRWFTEKEAAEYTGIPKDTLRKLRYEGKIRYGGKIGGRKIVYDREDLDEAITRLNKFHNPTDHAD